MYFSSESTSQTSNSADALSFSSRNQPTIMTTKEATAVALEEEAARLKDEL